MQTVNQTIKDKHDIFIKHFYQNYENPNRPPIWMIAEILSFGACSKLFKNLRKVKHKKAICDQFKQPPNIMDSWLRCLTYIRNICAHHARLWNKWIIYAPNIPRNDPNRERLVKKNRRFVVVAYIIQQLLKEIAPKSHWQQKLFELFGKYEHFVNFKAMGFQKEWRSDPFWAL